MLEALQDTIIRIISVVLGDFKWVVNTALVLITLIISARSYKYQVNGAIRESIEQLYDLNVATNGRIKPILHSTDMVCQKTIVEFKLYTGTNYTNTAKRARPNHFDLYMEMEKLEEEVGDVSDIDKSEFGIEVTIKSVNPVKCRRVVEEIMEEIQKRDLEIRTGEGNN
ncbi:hypothetical protein [Natrinema limicola]|uniref:hypothetical protein n=1 Tax=Natrinema limicola TaxID=370323 RepID=UPI0012673ACB|nr:hypothetical protein [Natrinema limicola]